MKLTLLGTSGSIISKSRTYPSFLVDGHILFDCGEGTTQKLLKLSSIDSIDTVCLSHLHNDHFMGIFSLIWHYWISGNKKQLKIVGPVGTQHTLETIMKLSNTPESLGNFNIEYIELEDINQIQEIRGENCLNAVKVEHGFPAFAYSIKKNGKKITYSGDTKLNQKLINLAHESDILICEATFPDKLRKFAHKHNHCTPSDSATIARDSDSRRLILVHISPMFESTIPEMKKQAETVFSKEVIIGEDLMEFEL
jgi:ribonuclease Z